MTSTFSTAAQSVDAVFADTWLTVSRLNSGFSIDKGAEFYQHACSLVDRAKQHLQDAGYSSTAIEHMLYAQCALLDETVMNRQTDDSGYQHWLKSPLQARYFNTLEAGAQLWDRIADVLKESSPDEHVLLCFHRVLLLGFSGQYRTRDNQERVRVFGELEQRVPAYVPNCSSLVVATPSTSKRSYRPVIIGAGVAMAIIVLWWFLSNSLQNLLQQLTG